MNDFNVQVKASLLPLLTSFGFALEKEFAGFLRFSTKSVRLTVSRDQRADEVNIFLGYKFEGCEFEEFDFNFALQVLDSTNEIKPASEKEGGADHMSYYATIFRDHPQILEGDREFVRRLRHHFQESVDRYNLDIIDKQLGTQANDAWSRKNYAQYVALLEPLEDKLSSVDSKRLRLARKYSES